MASVTSTSKAASIMPKALTISAMVIAALLFLLFGLDLAVGIPFGQASLMMDAGVLVSSALLGYMSWTVYREIK
jgi:hypothetical protein